jgi:hypothetical protein
MTDFTLNEGDDIVISSDTAIGDFYYKGGKIDIPPIVSYSKSGRFIFCPEIDSDPMNKIFGALVTRTEIETGKNGIFSGFQIYDTYPENKPLFFPCIVFGKTDREGNITQYLFGGEAMEGITIICDLAFKGDQRKTVGEILIEKFELANYYLNKMRELLKDIVFVSDTIKIGDFIENSSIQEPKEVNQTLWGFSMEITLNFKTINAE